MCEGIDGIAALESAVISVLELFKIPFTGASSYTAAVCLRKRRTFQCRDSPCFAAANRS